MIPVQVNLAGHKPRLPKAFSWSVGTQRLSQRFANIPQFGDAMIWYDDRPMDYRLRLDQVIRQGIPYQVFTVWYTTISTPHWFFVVYPVAAERKSLVRGLLEASAFPTVEAWLCEHKNGVWLASDKHLRCIYRPIEGRIEVKEESH